MNKKNKLEKLKRLNQLKILANKELIKKYKYKTYGDLLELINKNE